MIFFYKSLFIAIVHIVYFFVYWKSGISDILATRVNASVWRPILSTTPWTIRPSSTQLLCRINVSTYESD